MRVPWIRVHGGLYDKPVVDRLARVTKIHEHEAIGVLVTFWSGVAANAVNGSVGNVSDAQLERWAKWRRKRGVFAAWVRAEHLDADGRVREWDEYGGKLEVIRERDRLRKAAGNPKEFHRNGSGIPAEVPRNSVATRANETKRDETREQKDQKRTGTRSRPVPPWVTELAAVWTTHVGQVTPGKIQRALTALVAEYTAPVVKAALEVYVSPDEGPAPDKPKKPEWFAENFHRWRSIAETPIDDGHGALTDRGRRLVAAGAPL